MPLPPQCASKPRAPPPPPPPVEVPFHPSLLSDSLDPSARSPPPLDPLLRLQVGDMGEAAPPPKLLYIAVVDVGGRRAFRYTRSVLQSTLQLMGCKPRHAFKISKRVFNVMRSEALAASKSDRASKEENLAAGTDPETLDASGSSMPFELYKNQTTAVVSREEFLGVAKAKSKANKLTSSKDATSEEKSHDGSSELPPRTELIGSKQMAIEGYKAQSEMVIDSLDRLITSWEEQKESVIVEGVHLSLNFVMGLMKKHPSIIPFMVYITNEEKHMERFAVRAKYMTLDPAKNRYIKYIRNIRAIQEYLCNRADKHLVPKINNTNVDQSVAAIHATVFSCLRRWEAGEKLYDLNTNTVAIVDEEYRNQRAANTLGSKGMFQLIQRKGSSRNLMALLNTDGSVTKAWHIGTSDSNSNLSHTTNSEKAEAVNLQFGSFGISAWMNDMGGTSHAGSVEDLRADSVETCGRNLSSCCSSPKMSDSTSKELMEEYSVYGSEEEEADDPPDAETDEDLTDEERGIHEMDAGSVDELSTKSDEEYDDLAMRDVMENGDWSDDEQIVSSTKDSLALESTHGTGIGEGGAMGNRYHHSLELFLKMSKEVAAT
ncbi:hypothetical protein PR202_ga03316 [Eleusine coracana subsp. coracana]|uniref:P-loop NTPase domain-containing protein LPA1 homolog 1 n=1 Tax=Eleusine coracana subsp. coracana TaxID=191504 RepID=A0AAV5BQ14_ELECO|nr:hypothetical protein PR202_ga03316 [Eleusine coracana subsp. coracana]